MVSQGDGGPPGPPESAPLSAETLQAAPRCPQKVPWGRQTGSGAESPNYLRAARSSGSLSEFPLVPLSLILHLEVLIFL